MVTTSLGASDGVRQCAQFSVSRYITHTCVIVWDHMIPSVIDWLQGSSMFLEKSETGSLAKSLPQAGRRAANSAGANTSRHAGKHSKLCSTCRVPNKRPSQGNIGRTGPMKATGSGLTAEYSTAASRMLDGSGPLFTLRPESAMGRLPGKEGAP